MSEAVTLTIPREKPYHGIARLVVGGLAARRDVSLEDLEDLQLALDEILGNPALTAADAVTVEVVVEPGTAAVLVGPVDGEAVRRELERGDEAEGIGLRRLLETVAENVRVEARRDAEWLRLEKRVGTERAEANA